MSARENEDSLSSILDRLGTITTRLEELCVSADHVGDAGLGAEELSFSGSVEALCELDDMMSELVDPFVKLAEAISPAVRVQAEYFSSAFAELINIVAIASKSPRVPDQKIDLLLQPIKGLVEQAIEQSNQARNQPYYSHLSLVSSSIGFLAWPNARTLPASYIRDMKESAKFYFDRIAKSKVQLDIDWGTMFLDIIDRMIEYVEKYHKSGLVWNSNRYTRILERRLGDGFLPHMPRFELCGTQWIIENQMNDTNIVIDQPQACQTVYIYNCIDCKIRVKKQVETITMTKCSKVKLVVGYAKLVNVMLCDFSHLELDGPVMSVDIDRSNDLTIYQHNLRSELDVTTHSCVLIGLKGGKDNDTVLYIPEHFRTTFNEDGSLNTVPVSVPPVESR